MERKTKTALVVIVCVILAIVAIVIVLYGPEALIGERNHAKDYILDELDGEILECTIEEDVHMCHLIYREDGRKIGEIWIYYYPGGVEPYKPYIFKGEADQLISSDYVMIFLAGNMEIRGRACDLYNEKYGWRCTPFQRPE